MRLPTNGVAVKHMLMEQLLAERGIIPTFLLEQQIYDDLVSYYFRDVWNAYRTQETKIDSMLYINELQNDIIKSINKRVLIQSEITQLKTVEELFDF